MAKKVTAAEAGLLQLKRQTDRLIRAAKERSARISPLSILLAAQAMR
jgi:hypothetical protein